MDQKRENVVEKQLNRYIFPSMFAMVGTSCYILADTFFISVAAGANGITALNLALPVYAILFALGAMIGIGSTTVYSLDKSLGKPGYDDYFSNAILWCLILSSFFVLLGLTTPETVLMLMGADQEILNTGLPYMRTVLLFAPAFVTNFTMTSFVRNDNAPKIAMAATLTSSFVNIVLDYTFMFPLKMGMVGAALATGISPVFSMCVCMIHYLSRHNQIRFVRKLPRFRKLLRACSLGVSGFVGEISSGVTTFSFNYVLLGIAGNVGVAAYGVIANISLVGIAIFNGIAQGLQPMASEAGGEGDPEKQKRIRTHSQKVGIATALLFVAVCWCFSDRIVALFNSEHSVALTEYAVTGLKLYSIGFLLAALNIVNAGFLGAVGRAGECSMISLSRGIVAIVLFVILLPCFVGIHGVWLAFPAAELLTYILSRFFVE